MHKVLKNYLITSQEDLLRVVQRILDIVHSQYSKYQKDIATARHSIKFQHKPAAIPFLVLGIYKVITPTAIKLVRQQYLFR